MDPEIHHAAATRLLAPVEPRFVGAVGIVEGKVRREHFAEPALAYQFGDRPGCCRMAIGEVHSEQAVRLLRRLDHRARFGLVAPQRLLAEHCDPPLESRDRLRRVQRAGRGDDEAIELAIEHLVERTRDLRGRGDFQGGFDTVGRRIAQRRRRYHSFGDDRLHPVAADPAGAEKPYARKAHSKSTSALTKPSGLSRVASSASASRSSG